MALSRTDIFVSYARKSEASRGLIKHLMEVAHEDYRLLRQGTDNRLEEIDVKICLDEEQLRYGESILAFMDKVAQAERLILLISDSYLRSPYCMYECLSAYNAINNRYWPAIVFVRDSHPGPDPILGFDDNGLPNIFDQRYKDWWQSQLDEQKEEAPTDAAIPWYKQFIRMATEIKAWLVGRYWAGKPDRLLPVWSLPASPDPDEYARNYIDRALNPTRNHICCPSGDLLRARSIEAISSILVKYPELEKALNKGNMFAGDAYRRQFVEEMLDGNPAEFISTELAGIFGNRDVESLQWLREGADLLFGELVKYGVQIETLHYQLQELNAQQKGVAPILVSSESMLPEMSDAYLRDRRGAFRRIVVDGKDDYLGKRELVISDKNVLEIDEAKSDAIEQLKMEFILRAAKLFYTSDSGRPRRMPGPELLREGMKKRLASDDFVMKIGGISGKDLADLVAKLKENPVLRDVPIYVAAGETKNVIKTSSDWYDAVFDYYEARDQLNLV